jgi:hypothetical protein
MKLVPWPHISGTKVQSLHALAGALLVDSGAIATVLREVARPKAKFNQTLAILAPKGSEREAETADQDWRRIIYMGGEALQARDYASPPSDWSQAGIRLYTVLELVTAQAESQAGQDNASHSSEPNKRESTYDDKRRAKRRLQSVSRTSDHAKGAVPARHLDAIVTDECWEIEETAKLTRHTRTTLEETNRIVTTYPGIGWALAFSNGMSLDKSADEGRVPASFAANNEALSEALRDIIIEDCVGPSVRLLEKLESDITKCIAGMMHGAHSLEAIVRLFGALPSSTAFAEAGAVAGDPNMGRVGETSGPKLQTDMPRALQKYGDMFLMLHHCAGDAPAPSPKGLGLLELWNGAAGLQLKTTTMTDGETEVVGSWRLIEVALTRIAREMQERRRNASAEPIDFEALVRAVIETELTLALQRQQQWRFAVAISGNAHSEGKPKQSAKPNEKKYEPPPNRQQHDKPPQTEQRRARKRDMGESADEPPAKRHEGTPAGPPNREAWMTFKPLSITSLVGPRAGPGAKPSAVCAFDQLVHESYPNSRHEERPCAWASLLAKGCTKKGACRKCKFQQSLADANKPGNPVPSGVIATIKKACTPALLELFK